MPATNEWPSHVCLFFLYQNMSARTSASGLLGNVINLGCGELMGRACSVATVVWLGHRYGITVVGVYALAQSLTQYLQPLIDFGLRHVGARLVALYPHAACAIVDQVQSRRIFRATLTLPLLLAYAACAKLPLEMKVFLFVFSAAGALYAVSLDWVAWGQGHLRIVGIAKSAVPVSILLFLAAGRPSAHRVVWWLVAGNVFGWLLQAGISRRWNRLSSELIPSQQMEEIRASLAWRRTRVMGLAWLCNLAFNNIDVLMLGVMSSPEQVGLYGAAYRILNQVLATYYVLTQALYPHFARHDTKQRARMLRPGILLPLLAGGTVLAAFISLSRRPVLTVMFGHPFLAAAPLLALLAWSIPLDFLTSYLSNALIAWGLERRILLCTAIAAASDILLNLAFIPRFGARGAAANTLLSYGIFLAALGLVGRTATRHTTPSPSEIDAVACP
jgi:O-antigen/teichoic acid export membrane protein